MAQWLGDRARVRRVVVNFGERHRGVEAPSGIHRGQRISTGLEEFARRIRTAPAEPSLPAAPTFRQPEQLHAR